MVINQYDVFLISLDPAIDHEIKKVRPCVIISPNEMNSYIATVIVAPMTTKSHDYSTRISLNFQNKKEWIVLDQIRMIEKKDWRNELGG